MHDVLITGGLVVDGTGASGYRADVAVSGDRIAAVGSVGDAAAETIDARGMIVAPGFIDLHSHADFNFFIDRTADSKIRQGVTLEYVGNCGLSLCAPLIGLSTEHLDSRRAWYDSDWEPTWTDFAGYLDALRANGSPVCWGEDYDDRASPPTDEKFTAISSSQDHTCALRANGAPVCWGEDYDGRASPPPDERFTAISSGAWHTCALRADGSPVCWGDNSSGQASPPP